VFVVALVGGRGLEGCACVLSLVRKESRGTGERREEEGRKNESNPSSLSSVGRFALDKEERY
jgi:hypothetical protein